MRFRWTTFKRIIFWLALSYALLFPFFYWVAPVPLGMLKVKFDLWRGHYAIMVYGGPFFLELSPALNLKKYGIEYKRVAGCMVDRFVLGYAKGYNAVMEKEIARVFPKEVVTHLIEGKSGGDYWAE
jgi:hypothetical protein